MDVLKFELTKFTYGPDKKPSTVVSIKINGRDFLKMVTEHEKKILAGSEDQKLAGGHANMCPDDLYEELIFDVNSPEYHNKKTTVLICRCGSYGCGPFLTKVKELKHSVRWTKFEQPFHTKMDARSKWGTYWDFTEFGPFEFSKENYREQLEFLKRYL